jgi:ketosteroid isomerase-like protein
MNPQLRDRSCMLRPWLLVMLMVVAILTTSLLGDQGVEKTTEHGVEQAKTAVTHLEEKWLNALNKADVNAIAEVLAEDFVRPAPDFDQFVNRADLLRYYRSHLSPQGSDQRRIEDMKVTVYGPTALARGVVTTRDSKGRVIRKLLFTDVFVWRAGKWQAVSAQENVVTLPQEQAH